MMRAVRHRLSLRHTLRLACLALLLALAPHSRADIYIITHPDNPVAALSAKEVRKVFLGRLYLYPGTEHEPLAIDLPQTSPLYRHFYESVVGMSLPKLKRYRAYYLFSGKGKIPAEVASPADAISAIQRNTYAIGYIEDPSDDTLSTLKVLYRHRDD